MKWSITRGLDILTAPIPKWQSNWYISDRILDCVISIIVSWGFFYKIRVVHFCVVDFLVLSYRWMFWKWSEEPVFNQIFTRYVQFLYVNDLIHKLKSNILPLKTNLFRSNCITLHEVHINRHCYSFWGETCVSPFGDLWGFLQRLSKRSQSITTHTTKCIISAGFHPSND